MSRALKLSRKLKAILAAKPKIAQGSFKDEELTYKPKNDNKNGGFTINTIPIKLVIIELITLGQSFSLSHMLASKDVHIGLVKKIAQASPRFSNLIPQQQHTWAIPPNTHLIIKSLNISLFCGQISCFPIFIMKVFSTIDIMHLKYNIYVADIP
ncbi:hypothetical protein TTHERM_000339869 (macronuclear) [Tetrahymena thermophila SB210]|uniref:Uncharacterized protein n=1 Tax=Tetrahymena thermophila (strain SB210) TaxID=312017 RepID=W7XHT9_TETTS|nr:hypothetical protein TTHERM_000339869 [Tetrahymena thermophila SB210]EWS74041.1 hypothetical protein TTHERM_000339869 [Tetrahymena thermophila SB210]|eukprot:XP_012653440.1 hypothetical protein TTHERM_000339869 [Tetrahymena thermophila SB210]